MKTCILTAAILVLPGIVATAAEKQNGPTLAPQTVYKPQLGETAQIESPPQPSLLPEETSKQPAATRIVPAPPQPGSQIVQPRTQPAQPKASGSPVPTDAPPEDVGRQNEAAEAIVQAQDLVNQRRFEEAIRLSSRAIALDAANAVDFKRIRAAAYLGLGRYEEALADSSPLEVTVSSPRAELKTKQTVLGVVPGGTTVLIDDVKGKWLKVAAVGDTTYDWAWINQRDIQNTQIVERPAPEKIEYNIPSLAPMPIQPAPPAPIYYGPGRPYYQGAYGREYYDYWQHVPPQYLQFLPY